MRLQNIFSYENKIRNPVISALLITAGIIKRNFAGSDMGEDGDEAPRQP